MNHKDLAEIRAVGCTDTANSKIPTFGQVGGAGDIPFLLAKIKPRIEMDESGG